MASTCEKCGAALPACVQFCPVCGAAVVSATQPTSAQPLGTPTKLGGGTIKIILIIVAVIIGLGIIGVGAVGYIGYRIAKNMRVEPGGRMTMSTPGGAIVATPTQTFTTAELGTEIYPGAQSAHGGMKMEMPKGTVITGIFLTPDPPARVIAFYKDKLGGGASVSESFGHPVISLDMGRGELVKVTIAANSPPDNGKTRITITHTRNSKPF